MERFTFTTCVMMTDGQPLLASGGSSGISTWNLEKRRLQSVIREPHDGSIISLHFLANEPVLMSFAADNSIKMWVTQLMGMLVFYAFEKWSWCSSTVHKILWKWKIHFISW